MEFHYEISALMAYPEAHGYFTFHGVLTRPALVTTGADMEAIHLAIVDRFQRSGAEHELTPEKLVITGLRLVAAPQGLHVVTEDGDVIDIQSEAAIQANPLPKERVSFSMDVIHTR